MTETIASSLDSLTACAPVWGFVLIFVFMMIESSFVPFPSEVVMIPAGFLAYRCGLTTGIPWLDMTLAILCGKYFFLKEAALDRAEEVFREYGELATFVCRLLPAIRQLISIPAGLAKMDFKRFTFFTALGAGVWTTVLAWLGWYFASLAGDMTYLEMITRGKQLIHDNYIYVIAGVILLVGGYLAVHHKVMKSR